VLFTSQFVKKDIVINKECPKGKESAFDVLEIISISQDL